VKKYLQDHTGQTDSNKLFKHQYPHAVVECVCEHVSVFVCVCVRPYAVVCVSTLTLGACVPLSMSRLSLEVHEQPGEAAIL
jgi:hypothetical protein